MHFIYLSIWCSETSEETVDPFEETEESKDPFEETEESIQSKDTTGESHDLIELVLALQRATQEAVQQPECSDECDVREALRSAAEAAGWVERAEEVECPMESPTEQEQPMDISRISR